MPRSGDTLVGSIGILFPASGKARMERSFEGSLTEDPERQPHTDHGADSDGIESPGQQHPRVRVSQFTAAPPSPQVYRPKARRRRNDQLTVE
jgi:hypothetical protein